MPNVAGIMKRLRSLEDPEAVKGMARFGITPKRCLGVSMPALRGIAKETGKDHDLALALWDEGYREARILASMVDDVHEVTEDQMEAWIKDFDYWEICDQVIINLFGLLPSAYEKAVEWSRRDAEGEKRAGFVMMARLAVHDKKAPDRRMVAFFPHIKKGSTDDRTMVRKGVSWALRSIGKRNLTLNKKAAEFAREIEVLGTKASSWVGRDVLKDITRGSVIERLKKRAKA